MKPNNTKNPEAESARLLNTDVESLESSKAKVEEKYPLYKHVAAAVLDFPMGWLVALGFGVAAGLEFNHPIASALGGAAPYLNGRFNGGALGTWLSKPSVTSHDFKNMTGRAAGLLASGVTGFVLGMNKQFSENPVAESAMDGGIAYTAGLMVEQTVNQSLDRFTNYFKR